jgi:Plasmid encoded RepA protein
LIGHSPLRPPSFSREAARFIDAAVAMQDVDSRDARTLGYTARILTIATLPHRAQPGDHYERTNGGYRLIVQAMPGVGLPFGSYPRLLLSWLSTEIVRTRQRELELGSSMAQFLKSLGLQRSGGRGRDPGEYGRGTRSVGTIGRLKRQIRSLFGSRFILRRVCEEKGERIELLPIGEGMELWYGSDPASGSGFPSAVRVSEPFYAHVLRGPVPVDLRALRALKRSPLALDVYTWLTHRNFVLQNGGRAATTIPWYALQTQFGADYPLDSRGRADFKKAFHAAYRRVQLVYPSARLSDAGHALSVLPSAPHVRPRRMSASLA